MNHYLVDETHLLMAFIAAPCLVRVETAWEIWCLVRVLCVEGGRGTELPLISWGGEGLCAGLGELQGVGEPEREWPSSLAELPEPSSSWYSAHKHTRSDTILKPK